MKLVILQEDLNKALVTVSRSVSSKSSLPILANILLETEEGRLKLSATNLEVGINYWLGVKIDNEGSITIPARIVNELIASLPAAKIELETKESTLFLSTNNFKINVAGLDSAEFPKVPFFPKNPLAVFGKEDLIKGLSQVVIAAAQDEGRPVLTGVLFTSRIEGLTMVATDGYRLSLKKISAQEIDKSVEKLIIPGKTLQEVVRIAQETADNKGGSITIKLGLTTEKSQAVFSFPNIDFSTRLIEGEFPDYQKIIPQSSTTKVIFGKEEFLRAIKTASIIAREQANIVKLVIDPVGSSGKMTITAETAQVGANESEIEAKTEGEKLEIAFNYRFLLDFLNVVEGDEIIFEAGGPLAPGVFKPTGDDSFLHIIMPVRIQG
ncbi:DNA polymerase III subunit beta [Candidatus Shapirobacteria bacterium CG08_land_8_20_14_0_20_39_18]|uniref:Beta sliding clamp n=1 Tax=Candidatus Shapirobacteria bacterium CG08_land_8_20_14_0_20_39_18 TaxID=1974883 RepID=A0A2M6XCS1_9BACT|nr:MAG: DNA polymerase III subunit beta [Candidatus Shapirobacteria bacterium CG08_land_8_20_14_0_20_39_18]PIY65102.1 MAG: DNA polymerase III subunit beta [Candidatus Shapirobacteria bacterium CG_4_10_14_0_8_um_filter_39_15]PJE68187.1 MAG: DNA polymerase III subunit beta [Candidatus Shapirobacteria bacterium CG10_big_fil_rev_8_21_14_0_10_38_8]